MKAQARRKLIHSALMEGAPSKLPAPARSSIVLGDQKATNAGLLHSALLQESRHRQMRISYLLSAQSLSAPCPVRVLPQDLSADCYARYSVHLSSTEFSASQARIRMHCHEGMHLFLVQGGFLGQPKTDRPHDAAPGWEHAHFPLPSELYRVRLAHGTPTALSWRGKHICNH